MKPRLLLLIVLLQPGLNGWGQNWRPFVPGASYVYQLRDSTVIITQVANVDTQPNGDSLGTFVSIPKYNFNCQFYPGISEQPHSPFGARYRYNSRSVTFYTTDSTNELSDSLTLNSSLLPGSRYTSSAVQITYSGKSYELLKNGDYDSVRVFQVNYKTWWWSKSFGIIRGAVVDNESLNAPYPEARPSMSWGRRGSILTLVGHERWPNRRLVPTYRDLMPYSVGDSLNLYSVSRDDFSGNWYPIREEWSKTTINDITYDSARNSLNLSLRGKAHVHDRRFFSAALGRTIDTTYNYLFSSSSLILNYSKNVKPFTGGFIGRSQYGSNPLMYMAYLGDSIHARLLLRTSLSVFRIFTSDSCYSYLPDGDAEQTYISGIGLVASEAPWYLLRVIGYWKNGVRLYETSIPIATSIKTHSSLVLVSNPVATQLEVLSPTPLHLTLQDLQGRTVAEGWDTRTLDVRMLPPGLYQLRAQDKQGRSQMLRVAKD